MDLNKIIMTIVFWNLVIYTLSIMYTVFIWYITVKILNFFFWSSNNGIKENENIIKKGEYKTLTNEERKVIYVKTTILTTMIWIIIVLIFLLFKT